MPYKSDAQRKAVHAAKDRAKKKKSHKLRGTTVMTGYKK